MAAEDTSSQGLSNSSLLALAHARAACLARLAAGRSGPSGGNVGGSGGGSGSAGEGLAALDAARVGERVEPADLLAGVLLVHPDADGEGRVLLQHYGLTGRDVLPASYPTFGVQALRQEFSRVDHGLGARDLVQLQSLLDAARRHGSGNASLRHLLLALLELTQPLRWAEALAARGTDQTTLVTSYREWLSEFDASHRSGRVAGTELRRWLLARNPRAAQEMPRYASDAVDGRQDLIGVQAEADAFAYLIASTDLTPPLAVGLFGDWGSGKSFLIDAVDRRLDDLRRKVADSPQAEVRVWKSISRVRFNAWEYVQGNLWAGLLERILTTLGTLEPELVESRLRPVREELDKSAVTVATAKESLAGAIEERQKQEELLRTAENQAERGRRTAQEQALRDEAVRVLGEAAGALLDGKDGAELLAASGELRTEVARASGLLGPFWNRRSRIVAVTVAAAGVPVVSWALMQFAHWAQGAAVLAGLATLTPTVTATLRSAAQWSHTTVSAIDAAQLRVREAVARADERAEQELQALRAALTDSLEKVATAEAELRKAEERREALAARSEELTPLVVLRQFADERIAAYAKRAGLMSDVRRDLQKINDAIAKRNADLLAGTLADGGNFPNRIVLYIDDLDRCPPDKVVDVLQAVHLLLAFPMFVVIVAVDSRWLSSALTHELEALRDTGNGLMASAVAAGRATPQDYLEKIFQLPFWVQPVSPEGRRNLVHGLLSDSVVLGDGGSTDQSGGGVVGSRTLSKAEEAAFQDLLVRYGEEVRTDTSPLALDAGDLEFIEALAPLLGDTPRRVKRFVNTCQLLYAMSPPLRTTGGFPDDRHVVALMGAMAEGLPELSARLRTASADRATTTLADLVTGLLPSNASDPVPACGVEADALRLNRWLKEHAEWSSVTLDQLDVRSDLIARLRFSRPIPVP